MLASIHDILNMDPYNSIERRIEKDFNSKVLANQKVENFIELSCPTKLSN